MLRNNGEKWGEMGLDRALWGEMGMGEGWIGARMN